MPLSDEAHLAIRESQVSAGGIMDGRNPDPQALSTEILLYI